MSATFYRIINCLPILCVLLSLIGNFFTYFFWTFILNGVFKLILFICLILVEFSQAPAVVKPFSFMFYFFGRGAFYFFLGFITMGIDLLSVIGSFIIIAVGILYLILHFTMKNEEPEFMSFTKYQRLTSGISHELPTTTTYPVAHQTPIAEHNSIVSVPAEHYNNAQQSDSITNPVTAHNHNSDKTETD
ncbi:MAG: COPI associated protein-domain-containing protein [Benjaminiella poitrasii]|nr:MAG: COPI associated protein-domain-containing protein [Benjaminiella poitrasii]